MQRQFLRRIQKKTDYKARLAMLKSGLPRAVVRKSLGIIHLQIIKYDRKGDITLIEDSSGSLRKDGWKAHCGNIPAAYLIGYKLGKKALTLGIEKAISDIGLQKSTKEGVIYAALKGIQDSGLDINIGEITPDDNKIKGGHISSFAKKLKAEDKARYEKQFSEYIKNDFDPANIEKHFEEVKNKL